MSENYGIIDIGSNTIRLVIYANDKSGRLKEIENVKSVARLRDFLTEEKVLSDDGITILLETLLGFQEITRHHQLKNVRCVATATVRQACNQTKILTAVKHATDFTIRILSEYEEAYYGYLAVVNSTSLTEGITIDIGGGSTEITYFHNRKLIEYYSFPFGGLSLKKKFISEDIPNEAELEKLSAFLFNEFRRIGWLNNRNVPIVAIGGSARNMVQIDQAIKNYPLAGLHQYEMTNDDICNVQSYTSSHSFVELQKIEGLSNDRADTIIPAIEVFNMLFKVAGAPILMLSRKGLRDGIFFEEFTKSLGITVLPNVKEESFYALSQDYEINLSHVRQLTKLATMLFEQIRTLGYAPLTDQDLKDLKCAAFVFFLGEYIDSESSSQHTFYLLANRTIDGFMHRERVKLALLASFKNKTVFKQFMEPFNHWFSKEEQKKLRLLGAILKLAYSLNATKRDIVNNITIHGDEDGIVIEIFCRKNWHAEKYQSQKQKKHLEKIVKEPIYLIFNEG